MAIVWLESHEIILFQNSLISEHGGLSGPSNEGALESTLARPQQLPAYEQTSIVFDLASSYVYGFARNHCFPDGNKRLALTSIDVFLMTNGHELIADEVEAAITIRAVAEGQMSQPELSTWIETNSTDLLEEI